MALPLEVAPFPAAESSGAVLEQAIDAVDVVGRPFAFGQGHAVEVEEALGAFLLSSAAWRAASVAWNSSSSRR